MLRIATKTKLNPREAILRAIKFFGPAGLGLEVEEQAPEHIHFRKGMGMVDAIACAEGKETSMELVSREWDDEVKKFVKKLPR